MLPNSLRILHYNIFQLRQAWFLILPFEWKGSIHVPPIKKSLFLPRAGLWAGASKRLAGRKEWNYPGGGLRSCYPSITMEPWRSKGGDDGIKEGWGEQSLLAGTTAVR